MSQSIKTDGLVVTLLGLFALLAYAIHAQASAEVVAVISAAIGAGTTAAFKYFTSGNGTTGPGAVLLVGLVSALAGQGCKPAETPREQARSVVLSVAEGVRAGDEACASIARARGDVTLAEGCAAIVTEARSALLVAEESIDAWQAADEGKLACAVKASASALERILDTVRRAGGKTPPAVEDALRLAPLLAGACRG